jgi:hypothetical protein
MRERIVITSTIAWLLACGEPGSVVVVDVLTDYRAGLDFESIEVVAQGLDDEPRVARRAVTLSAVDGQLEELRAAELEGIARGSLRLDVRLRRADGEVLVTRGLIATVDGPLAVTVLLTRSCRDRTCGSDELACLASQCVDPRCETLGAGEGCGVADCAADADCASAGCAVGRCVAGACVTAPSDDACAADEVCGADGACVPRPALDGGTCPTPCDLVSQCGCGVGEMCTIPEEPPLEPRCVAAGGTALGGSCTRTEECAAGTACVQSLMSSLGICRRWCRSDADCAADAPCVDTVEVDAGTCAFACDPVADAGCPDPLHCRLTVFVLDTGQVPHTTCAGSGPGAEGAACTDRRDCAAGTDCLEGRCVRLCRLPAGDECTGGRTCTALDPPVVVEGTRYGACL